MKLGKQEFSVSELDSFAKTAGTGSVFGYYDLNALQLAADSRGYDISFFDARKNVQELPLSDSSVVGILVNTTTPLMYFFKSKHWFCIRKTSNSDKGSMSWYLLDSKRKKPESLEQDQIGPLIDQLRKEGAQVLLFTRKDESTITVEPSYPVEPVAE